MRFVPGIRLQDSCLILVSDASFDNVPGHKSQRGTFVYIADKRTLDDHSGLYKMNLLSWSWARISRVVKSTLAAEVYALSYAVEMLDWCRAVVGEIQDSAYDVRNYKEKLRDIPAAAVTDCKSLYGTILMEKVYLQDRRFSLEAAFLRQAFENNIRIKWVKSEQMLSDTLTKALPRHLQSYARLVPNSNQWTLGPDPRCPESRRIQPACRALTKRLPSDQVRPLTPAQGN